MTEHGMTPIFDTLLLEFELEWPVERDAGKPNGWFDSDTGAD